MKTKFTFLTFIAAIAMTSFCMGQTLFPNANFEHWTKDANNFLNPTYWATSNIKVVTTSVTTVTKDSLPAQDSSYCVRLESKDPIGTGSIAPGLVTLGKFTLNIFSQTGTVSGGIPFSDKPTFFRGYYKATPQSGDQCFIALILFKWNAVTGKSDTIGQAFLTNASTVSTWTYFDLPINYRINNTNPDTLNIVIMSSDGRFTPKKSSVLWIDNLSLGYTVNSAEESSPQKEFNIYPNPVAKENSVTIDMRNYNDVEYVKIMDAAGNTKIIFNKELINNSNLKIDVSSFASGTYFIEMKMKLSVSIWKMIKV